MAADLLALAEVVMAVWGRFKAGEIEQATLQQVLQPIQQATCQQHQRPLPPFVTEAITAYWAKQPCPLLFNPC